MTQLHPFVRGWLTAVGIVSLVDAQAFLIHQPFGQPYAVAYEVAPPVAWGVIFATIGVALLGCAWQGRRVPVAATTWVLVMLAAARALFAWSIMSTGWGAEVGAARWLTDAIVSILIAVHLPLRRHPATGQAGIWRQEEPPP